MKHALISILLLVLTAGSVAYWLYGGKTASAADLPTRAVAAFNERRYDDAIPLFKQWAALPDVRANPDKLKVPLAFLQQIDSLKASTQPAAPLSPAQVLKNAEATIKPTGSTPWANAASPSPTTDPAGSLNRTAQQPTRTPHKKPAPGETVSLAVKELGNFPFDPEKDTDVPPDLYNLEGAHVRLRGYMLTLTQAEQITKFAVVPSLLSCCFGQPPGPEHVVIATTPPGKSVDFSMDEIDVDGILHVRPQRKDGYTYSIFELDVTGVRTRE